MEYGIWSNMLFFAPVIIGVFMYQLSPENHMWDLHAVLLLSYTTFFSWFGFSWLIFLFQDNLKIRYNMLNALYWTKKGIYAINWVGVMNWLMLWWELDEVNNSFTYVFFAVWVILDFILVMIDTHIAPTVEYWLLNAPYYNRKYNGSSPS
jgi:hypothetical protein